jgi:NTP pyrophosphatase (non-canonical NTP hydrolase)
MKEFETLVDTCRKSLRHDPWVSERGLYGYFDELVSEIDEVRDALGNKSSLKEELGDVLMDWVHVCLLAGIPIEETIADVTDKLNRRKPYLSEGRDVSKEEAVVLWRDAKKAERR